MAKKLLKYIPLAAAACIIPLLVHITATDCGLSAYDWFSKSSVEYDFFLIYKMYGIMATAAVMLAGLIYGCCKKRRAGASGASGRPGMAVFACLIMYAVLSVLSALFAHNPHAAFLGGYAQHEPAPVLVSYVIIFIYTYFVLNDEDSIITFIKIVVPGAFVMALIGLLQWLGADFFASNAGKCLISLGSGIDPHRITASFGKGMVYMTLYNPNYVGVYAVLMIPLCVTGVIIIKNAFLRTMSAAAALMLVCCLIGSQSEAGVYACLVMCVVCALSFIYIYNKRAGRIILCIFAVAGLVISLYNLKQGIVKESIYPLEYMGVSEDGADIRIRGKTLHIESRLADSGAYGVAGISGDLDSSDALGTAGNSGVSIEVFDENGNPVELTESDGALTPADGDAAGDGAGNGAGDGAGDKAGDAAVDEAYADLHISTGVSEEGYRGFYVTCGDISLFFTNDNEQGKYLYRNVYGRYTDDLPGEGIAGGENTPIRFRDDLASHRGYIWTETIPLLGRNIILGCGPDNFVYEFPNNDYLALLNNGYSARVVTRPHNIYLQTAAQTGVISLVMVLLVYGMYIVSSICMIRNAEKNIKNTKNIEYTEDTDDIKAPKSHGILRKLSSAETAGIMIFAACTGYMVCGLSNDSSICTAPVFWVIFAAGFCCNEVIKRKNMNNETI